MSKSVLLDPEPRSSRIQIQSEADLVLSKQILILAELYMRSIQVWMRFSRIVDEI
jgi:hypothetical protein